MTRTTTEETAMPETTPMVTKEGDQWICRNRLRHLEPHVMIPAEGGTYEQRFVGLVARCPACPMSAFEHPPEYHAFMARFAKPTNGGTGR